jgi:predicted nucleic acid-binding protein
MVFADTSALFPLLDQDDVLHGSASRTWRDLRSAGDLIISTNYVMVETFVLVQNRLGLQAAKDLADSVFHLILIEWVTPEVHQAGIDAVLAASRRDLSLVDCISFAVMRRLGLSHAFAVDEHFREQGFDCLPAQG